MGGQRGDHVQCSQLLIFVLPLTTLETGKMGMKGKCRRAPQLRCSWGWHQTDTVFIEGQPHRTCDSYQAAGTTPELASNFLHHRQKPEYSRKSAAEGSWKSRPREATDCSPLVSPTLIFFWLTIFTSFRHTRNQHSDEFLWSVTADLTGSLLLLICAFYYYFFLTRDSH